MMVTTAVINVDHLYLLLEQYFLVSGDISTEL